MSLPSSPSRVPLPFPPPLLLSSGRRVGWDWAGLLVVLEFCLSSEAAASIRTFEMFIAVLNFHTVFFWKRAVPLLIDSDMLHGTSYRDALLFSLTLHDVNKVPSLLQSFTSTLALLLGPG